MNAATMFAWWGLFLVDPVVSRAAAGSGRRRVVAAAVLHVDRPDAGRHVARLRQLRLHRRRVGRKRTYVTYLVVAAVLVPVYGDLARPALLLPLGPVVAFFGTGYFSGFGAVTAEIFPTRIRATAQGMTYNVGRGISAAAPFAVGALSRPRRSRRRVLMTSARVPGRRAPLDVDTRDEGRVRSTGVVRVCGRK